MVLIPDFPNLPMEEAKQGAKSRTELAKSLLARGDAEGAFAAYLHSAKHGHAQAQVEVGRMLLHGIGTQVDLDQALEWLGLAEDQGNPAASYQLALCAVGGQVLPFDDKVNQRLVHAVQANYPPAMLAAAIHVGRRQHPEDQNLCLYLLRSAAEAGSATAAMLLAERLELGEGCARNPQAAAHLRYQLAQAGFESLPAVCVPQIQQCPSSPRTVNLLDALSSPATPTQLSRQPKICMVEGLLSADECRLLIASSQPRLRRSHTLDPLSGTPLLQALRTSSDASHDPVGEDMAVRLAQLRMASAAALPLVHAESLVVLRYAPGEEYRPHRDYLPPSGIERDGPHAGNRLRTICAYLNQVEEGGQTEFPLVGVRVQPVAGSAVVFDNLHADGRPDSATLHAGLPVASGEKWLATLWLRQRPYRSH